MAWAIEEYKAILLKAYPRWYKAKTGKAKKQVETAIQQDLEKVNRDRAAARAPPLPEPKLGFPKVILMWFWCDLI
jgi:hypothetical protein